MTEAETKTVKHTEAEHNQPILEIQNYDIIECIGIMFLFSICPIILLDRLLKSDSYSYPEITDDIKMLAKVNMISCIVLNVCFCILVYFNYIGEYVQPNIFNKIYKVLYFCNLIFTIVMCSFVLNLDIKDHNVFRTLYSLIALCLVGFMVSLFFIL
jgi:hypothetical protein